MDRLGTDTLQGRPEFNTHIFFACVRVGLVCGVVRKYCVSQEMNLLDGLKEFTKFMFTTFPLSHNDDDDEDASKY